MSRILALAAAATALAAGCLLPVDPEAVPGPADAQLVPPLPSPDASTHPPPPPARDAGGLQPPDASFGSFCDLAELTIPLPPGERPTPPGWGTDAPSDELRQVAAAMVGTWNGWQSNPWDGQHPVELTFFPEGLYSAAGLDGQPPFHYNVVCSSHRSYWRLDEGNLVQASGELQIWFDVGSSTVEEIRHVRVVGDSLTFDQWHFNQYGPIHFELQRVR